MLVSDIALYDLLRQLPGVSNEQAKEAVDDIAKKEEIATKLDIAESKADIGKLETEFKYMRWMFLVGLSLAVTIIKLL